MPSPAGPVAPNCLTRCMGCLSACICGGIRRQALAALLERSANMLLLRIFEPYQLLEAANLGRLGTA